MLAYHGFVFKDNKTLQILFYQKVWKGKISFFNADWRAVEMSSNSVDVHSFTNTGIATMFVNPEKYLIDFFSLRDRSIFCCVEVSSFLVQPWSFT